MEDMYRIANISLRMQNLQLQQEVLAANLKIVQNELRTAGDEMNTKYGLDPKKQQVQPDGTIINLDAMQMAAVQQRLAAMGLKKNGT